MSTKVIVFGPTGGVASATAIAAQKHGAKVYLGMRDTTKPIPNLNSTQEKAGDFSRIQADLTQPSTLKEAALKSGAKHAFVYLKAADLKASLSALKEGGVSEY